VPVADERMEPVDFYKASGLKIVERAADVVQIPPPWLGVPPELPAAKLAMLTPRRWLRDSSGRC
jgi:hypothetical protein